MREEAMSVCNNGPQIADDDTERTRGHQFPAAVANTGDTSQTQHFDNIINFRDVGAVINNLCGSRIMKEKVLYRSATPDDASTRDKERLEHGLGLATIVDLRSSTEHFTAADRHRPVLSSETEGPSTPPPSSTAEEHLLSLPHLSRVMVSLTGRSLYKLLLWRLSWYDLLKFLTLTAMGYRIDAIKILTSQVMQSRGLIGLAHDTLAASTAEIAETLTHLAQPRSYPVLIHCSQGKDRTGLIISLVLLLLSEPMSACNKHDHEVPSHQKKQATFPLSAIEADYALSDDGLAAERDEWTAELDRMGLGPEFGLCVPGFVSEIKTFLDEQYGGVVGYVRSAALSDETIGGIRGCLLENGKGDER